MFGASFPFKIQEKCLHKEFRGGVLGAPIFFMLNFFAFRMLFFAPDKMLFLPGLGISEQQTLTEHWPPIREWHCSWTLFLGDRYSLIEFF